MGFERKFSASSVQDRERPSVFGDELAGNSMKAVNGR